MKRVLMIAYHFPPLRGSSGIQRTLRFCRYLPEFEWTPLLLTAHVRAYESVDIATLADISPRTIVHRAFALNSARHLAIGGRYPSFLAIPDRWASWFLGGVVSGMSLIRRTRPQVIFSTFPIATAHMIGLALHRLTGLPWIADFRDPMAQDGYPADQRIWHSFKWIEQKALRYASRSLFTSPGAIRDYRRTYPDIPEERFVLLENGYDEEAFEQIDAALHQAPASARTAHSRLVILHSGIVYPSERDPTQLFSALGTLKRAGTLGAADVEFRFRASANEPMLRELAQQQSVDDIVSVLPHIPYSDALAEMMSVDGLLLMQAANCNAQIPAKAYEYLRAGRPILALTDAAGDTADLMRRAGVTSVAPLNSSSALETALPRFVASLRNGSACAANTEFIPMCSRRARTRMLVDVLNACANDR
jgi:hypothetical protein